MDYITPDYQAEPDPVQDAIETPAMREARLKAINILNEINRILDADHTGASSYTIMCDFSRLKELRVKFNAVFPEVAK